MKVASVALVALIGTSVLAAPEVAVTGGTTKIKGSKKKKSKKKSKKGSCGATIAIANRVDGTLSILDAEYGDLIKTVDMPKPSHAHHPQPMYVNAIDGIVYVGDRANDWVAVFDATRNYKVVKLMAGGSGIFHQVIDQAGSMLWVNNDIDKTITVYDLTSLSPVKTIELAVVAPDECTGEGKPHDSTLSWDGKLAFITCIHPSGGSVLKFDTSTYELLESVTQAGRDPHVGLTWRNNKLYVPNQGDGTLYIYDQGDLEGTAPVELKMEAAHGITMFSQFDKFGHVIGISTGVFNSFDFDTDEFLGSWRAQSGEGEICGVGDGCDGSAHNIVGTGKKLFVTHSGTTATTVSIYDVDKDDGEPVFSKAVKVGTNPFGLDFVESTCDTSDIF